MSWSSLQKTLKSNLKDLNDWEKDDLLKLVGLESRREPTDWILPTLTAFSVGVLVGAGVGLLLAPKSGRETREELRNRLQRENAGSGQRTLGTVAATGPETPRSV